MSFIKAFLVIFKFHEMTSNTVVYTFLRSFYFYILIIFYNSYFFSFFSFIFFFSHFIVCMYVCINFTNVFFIFDYIFLCLWHFIHHVYITVVTQALWRKNIFIIIYLIFRIFSMIFIYNIFIKNDFDKI